MKNQEILILNQENQEIIAFLVISWLQFQISWLSIVISWFSWISWFPANFRRRGLRRPARRQRLSRKSRNSRKSRKHYEKSRNRKPQSRNSKKHNNFLVFLIQDWDFLIFHCVFLIFLNFLISRKLPAPGPSEVYHCLSLSVGWRPRAGFTGAGPPFSPQCRVRER